MFLVHILLGLIWGKELANLGGKTERKCFDDVNDLRMNDSSFCFQTSFGLSRCLNFCVSLPTMISWKAAREEKLLHWHFKHIEDLVLLVLISACLWQG